ncbi:MAG: peptidoglycan DD-metalloendopeptidase family protein [Thermoleophilia bacterium]|nr:peptidoglycan DD-metalloendopeptidase family protein [Thermoleophilia bacterium]
MFRSLVITSLTVLLLVFVTVASAGVLEARLGQTRTEAQQAKADIVVVDRRQASITRQLTVLNRRVAALDVPINNLSVEINGLDYRIARRRDRIAKLKLDFVLQKVQIAVLNGQLTDARDLLASRVVAAYTHGETGMLEQLAGSGSLSELFNRQEVLGEVVGVDQTIIDRIDLTQRAVRLKRSRNHIVQQQIHTDIAALDAARGEVDGKRAKIKVQRAEVVSATAERDKLIAALNTREGTLNKELDNLEADAGVLQEAIRTGAVTYAGVTGSLSAQGLIYPVNGQMVSPFGQRWGRLHAGVDLAVPTGTPIHAAASGVVTWASWMSGYGNMVQIQHAGILSTGYGHQSQIAVHVGQLVNQGDVIGYVGCTGHCFGPHVHFETRENGTPVDPMKYL